ncbi:MAG: hypothetical protein IT449_02515 [Phycisphaerales bacterium]|nr:hypothetical protein [Phycisphaerales bacterium]
MKHNENSTRASRREPSDPRQVDLLKPGSVARPRVARLLLAATVALLACVASPCVHAQDTADDLKRKLIKETTGGADDGDVMSRILALMGQTARRLEVEFNPGADTQKAQETLIKELDDAIKQAAANTRKNKSQSSPSSDKRTAMKQKSDGASKPKPDAGRQGAPQQDGESVERDPPAGDGQTASSKGRDLTERRRGWGNLPLRDRDEVIEGMDESVLPRFRDWIERYYRALQTAGDEEE